MKKLYVLLTVVSIIILLTACGNETQQSGSEVTELKLAHNQSEDHPVHKSLQEFGRLVKEKSDGDMTIDIAPNGQLGSEREVIELTQTGAVDLAKVSASALESFEPEYSIFSLPYVFDDYQDFEKTMNNEKITDRLYQQTEEVGFRGLTYYNAGSRNLYTQGKKVTKPSDMNGLKVRVQPSETSVGMIESFGGIPTTMDYGEVYTALQSGVIDAAENNETALVNNNHGEVANYYMYTEHQIVPDMLISNSQKFNDFTEDQQRIIQEAAKESTAFHEDVWQKTIKEQTETAKNEMNVEFVEVDKTPFKESVQTLHNQFSKDEKTEKIYDLIAEGE